MCSDERPRVLILCSHMDRSTVEHMVAYIAGAHSGKTAHAVALACDKIPEGGLAILSEDSVSRKELWEGRWVIDASKAKIKKKGVERSWKPRKHVNHYT